MLQNEIGYGEAEEEERGEITLSTPIDSSFITLWHMTGPQPYQWLHDIAPKWGPFSKWHLA